MKFLALVPLVFAVLAAAANTKQYDAIQKAAGSKKLQLGHQYAFTISKGLHKRLIVGKVTGSAGNLDFDATNYELFETQAGKVDIDKKTPYKTWDCTKGKYSYKAEVDGSLTFADIQMRGEALMVGKDEYKLLTNNCRTYVRALIKDIKARALVGRGLSDPLALEWTV